MKHFFVFMFCVINSACLNQPLPVYAKQSLPAQYEPAGMATDSSLLRSTLKKPACTGKKIYIKKGDDNGIYLDGKSFSYTPGDTLVLKASGNPYSYFSLGNLHGSEDCPVTIINEDGQVNLSNGMAFENCSYINVTGTGCKKEKYGFKVEDIASNGVGVDIHGRSAHIEVQHFFIHKKMYGFWIKQEGCCVDSLQYPNWVINSMYIHDNKITQMGQEGMYLGSTDPNGAREVSCNGKVIAPKPLRLGNIKVYNNIIDSTGRSGIQLSCGQGMLNEIYNNEVNNCGFELSPVQGNGISLGGYTQAQVYNNTINNTYALGILCLGSGSILIKNNNINNSGYLSGQTANGMAGIMIDTRPTQPVDSTKLFILNNQIGKNTDHAIRVYRTVDSYAKGNVICNNSGNAEVDKKVNWINECAYKK
ncbi:right-handed parallel beta-helix repeat-containing protein [Parafilimonas sp.]|uniref:right-handed parallel beta-helix repeat-containing protein n=1 Tax=Parafilimonas sp. TaxID=1969739 RepID=UPI0039E55339